MFSPLTFKAIQLTPPSPPLPVHPTPLHSLSNFTTEFREGDRLLNLFVRVTEKEISRNRISSSTEAENLQNYTVTTLLKIESNSRNRILISLFLREFSFDSGARKRRNSKGRGKREGEKKKRNPNNPPRADHATRRR